MILLNELLKDFEKVANEIKTTAEKVEDKNFICRLVICYEDKEKEANATTYKEVKAIEEELNKIDFDYKIKANKYIYILHKKEFEKEEEFIALQKVFMKKDKILTVNLKNFSVYKKQIEKFIELLKDGRKAKEEKKTEEKTEEKKEEKKSK